MPSWFNHVIFLNQVVFNFLKKFCFVFMSTREDFSSEALDEAEVFAALATDQSFDEL